MKRLIIFCASAIVCFACSKKTDIDPLVQVKPTGLFSFKVIQEGDGLVSFAADSTQTIKEFTWDFGDGSTATTMTTGKVSHNFTKNAPFQVKLTAKNGNNQVSDSKQIIINTRLARTFTDVPQDQRSKLRILHIIVGTKNGINPQNEIDNFPVNYLNDVYQDFISNHSTVHQAEFNNLTFENHYFKLNANDSSYFAKNSSIFQYSGNPIRQFLDGNTTDAQQKDIFNKTLETKRNVGASIVIFWIPFSIGQFGGYAQGINSYTSICPIPDKNEFTDNAVNGVRGGRLFWNRGMTVLAHEMGHNLGMPHDVTSKPCNFLMSGLETTINPSEQKYNLFLPVFQSKEYDFTFARTVLANYLGSKGEVKVNYCVQEKYFTSNIFNQNYFLDKVIIRGENNSGENTFFPALESHIIEQYNIKLAPNKVTGFEKQIPRNGRLSANKNMLSKPIE